MTDPDGLPEGCTCFVAVDEALAPSCAMMLAEVTCSYCFAFLVVLKPDHEEPACAVPTLHLDVGDVLPVHEKVVST